ncbi:MAG: VanZ family protein [Planococcaceae bacterium]|nr:VanZ family protein [Planococcaceae bacterium]
MHTIIYYLQDMWFYMAIALPVILIYRFYRIKKSKHKTKPLHEIGVIAFLIFLIGLLSQTVIPSISFNNGSIEFVNGNFQAVNLEFFRVFRETYNAIKYLDLWQPFLINFMGNIFMFMPIGFLLPLLWRKFEHIFWTVLAGFLLSLSIELLQLTQLRSSDVDDLWLNTLGTFIGFICFTFIPKKHRHWFKKEKVG